MNSAFKWNDQKADVALALAQGRTQKEIAAEFDITDRTIRLWLAEDEFRVEVDRLSLMIGIAARAERLRIAQRVVRQKTSGDVVLTDKDLLEWLKFAQSETDGINLNLDAAFSEAVASMAASRQASPPSASGDKPRTRRKAKDSRTS